MDSDDEIGRTPRFPRLRELLGKLVHSKVLWVGGGIVLLVIIGIVVFMKMKG